MNIAHVISQVVLNSMSMELADLKSANPQEVRQLQAQMQQQLQQLQQDQEQSRQDSAQPARGALLDVNA